MEQIKLEYAYDGGRVERKMQFVFLKIILKSGIS